MKQTRRPILFLHTVDTKNINAQSNNIKALLTNWDCPDFPVEALYFDEPEPAVAANRHVRLWKMPRNRLWKLYALRLATREYSAVCYPGLAPEFDDQFRRLRHSLGMTEVVISTLEGLPADQRDVRQREVRLSDVAGHPVYCQPVAPAVMSALDRLKGNSDLIVAISPFLQRMARHIWERPCVEHVPLGVHLDRFHAYGRRAHGSNPRPQVVSAGNCNSHKRPELFLKLAREHKDVEFVWYGDGKQRAELMALSKSAGIMNIQFPGSVDSVALANAFRKSDIFVLPSASEGVPKVTQEAAACGLPVVCMAYYEPFSVVHQVNGFQAGDDASLMNYTSVLIGDWKLRAQMGTAAAKIANDWDWRLLAPRWQLAITDFVRARTN